MPTSKTPQTDRDAQTLLQLATDFPNYRLWRGTRNAEVASSWCATRRGRTLIGDTAEDLRAQLDKDLDA